MLALSGMLRTECNESSLQLTSSLEMSRRTANDAVESGDPRTTIVPTIS